MNTLVASKPVLVSPFLGYKLSRSSGNSKRVVPNRLYLPPRNFKAKCTMDTSCGDNVSNFPRSNVWDPYKRLGISKDASEEELWNSRKFLLDQYGGNQKSVESIEAAFEKILMKSFLKSKKTKMNLKSRLRKKVEESPPWVRRLISLVELPSNIIIIRRLFLFAFMACWSVYSSEDGGPAFQVALSLMASMYFLHDKTKNLARASIIAVVSLVVGWICGSFLAPMIPLAFLQPTWSLELLTALFAYVFLFLGCTFLK